MSAEPTFEKLARMWALRRESGEEGGESMFFGTFLHRNLRFWKYYWWVFSRESEVEGDDFFDARYRLCTHDAMALIERIVAAGDICFVYNERLPHRGPDTPFDETHPSWEGVEWAPPYDEDPDPVCPDQGGHR